MKHSAGYACIIGIVLMLFPVKSVSGNITGDVKLACEALLCLSSGIRPPECSAALRRYFNIWNRKPHKRIRARLNFLNLCPAAGQTPEMKALTSALSRGAGSCSAERLNRSLMRGYYFGRHARKFYIDNTMPRHCKAIYGHEYTDYADSSMPVYVGEKDRGGYWVEAKDYEKAMREYKREKR